MALSLPLLVLAGVAILGTVVVPRLLDDDPLSVPIIYVGFGPLVITLPIGLPAPDPIARGDPAEHLTELGVIVALMRAGLKLDRPLAVWSWRSAWRLLGITMPVTIAATEGRSSRRGRCRVSRR